MSEPSFSVSGKPLKSTPQTVTNGEPFWPDLDLAELQGSRTLPADLPDDTAAMALLAAVAEVNTTLAPVVAHWKAQGHERAADVPGARLGDETQLVAQYKRPFMPVPRPILWASSPPLVAVKPIRGRKARTHAPPYWLKPRWSCVTCWGTDARECTSYEPAGKPDRLHYRKSAV